MKSLAIPFAKPERSGRTALIGLALLTTLVATTARAGDAHGDTDRQDTRFTREVQIVPLGRAGSYQVFPQDPDVARVVSLGGTCRRCELSGRNLSGATFTAATFIDATLVETNLRGSELVGSNFSRADFTRADLRGATLVAANFTGAVFTDARMDGIEG